MNSRDIAQLRLINQRLAGPPASVASASAVLATPAGLVRWMGCIQAQDYAMAKWAIGCRLQKGKDADIEKAFNEGSILRSHALRPTWHFVCPEDIRWLISFNAPRVRVLSRPYHRQFEIDQSVLKKSKKLLMRALGEQGPLTRPQLAEVLRKGKIATNDARLGHILMDAELDAILCSAGRIGKQFAFGLLDELVPAAGGTGAVLSTEEAIAELALRYFPSRGPATVQDFAWWGGLTLTEARKGLEVVREEMRGRGGLESVKVNGHEYWHKEGVLSKTTNQTYLLPAFDEFTVAYKNREDVLDPARAAECGFGLKPILVHNTRIVGSWQRKTIKKTVKVEISPFQGAKPVPQAALAKTVKKYEEFIQGN